VFLPLLTLTLSGFAGTTWQTPPDEIRAVLDAPSAPRSWVSPDGESVLQATRVRYPPLVDLVAAMEPLAGVRVDTRNNSHHGWYGYKDPRIVAAGDGDTVTLALPEGGRVLGVEWSADGDRLALQVRLEDHIGLWVGGADGVGAMVPDLALNPLLGSTVAWLPDQERLLVKRIPAERGAAPAAPAIPDGPIIRSGDGDSATSTYEARDVLTSAHDERLFEHYMISEIAVVDGQTVTAVGAAGLHAGVSASPNGQHLLVQTLQGPWSHRHAWWRFGRVIAVWSIDGEPEHVVADLPLADAVPIHGVREGPRSIYWRATAPASLLWIEALDGGDWSTEVPHRDRLMTQRAPFSREPTEVFRAEHRVDGWWWGGKRGTLLVRQYERTRRWRHYWLLDVDRERSRALFDLSRNDRYADPGYPVMRALDNGEWVMRQVGDDVFYAGGGASPTGDRPFLDRRSLRDGSTERLFRSDPERYERFIGFTDPRGGGFLVAGEAPEDPPGIYRAAVGAKISAEAGEPQREIDLTVVTKAEDPAPALREIERRLVTYEREDGVPLSFTLYLPPDYEEGTALPTVVYAYPLEFSDAETAGQVRGSLKTFSSFRGPSHLFFALQGYAVLHNTRMPVIGDPDTMYDTFVEQLVSGADAAVAEAVKLGVTDPERVGVMGHSHGGLMTVTLLAHSDTFSAGIARSGAYNHTIRPFGFQNERRTLWAAKANYINISPVMHAPDIDEPLLIIHGEKDQNPGTIPFQSERLFEAVRGTGGTVRLLMLPHEGHGYRARESVEHVLWEQLTWFDTHVRGAADSPPSGE